MGVNYSRMIFLQVYFQEGDLQSMLKTTIHDFSRTLNKSMDRERSLLEQQEMDQEYQDKTLSRKQLQWDEISNLQCKSYS